MTAQYIESLGIPTVVIGSARDIVEEAGVPRFVFTDMPLGNPYGEPGDVDTQRATLALALDVAAKAFAPRTTVQADTPWTGPPDWRATYMHVGDDNRAELLAAGQRRMAKQSARKS